MQKAVPKVEMLDRWTNGVAPQIQAASANESFESPTQAVAEFAYTTGFDDLSSHDICRLTRLVIEAVGCALGARVLEQGRMYNDFAQEHGGRQEATILGTSTRTSAAMAAWANAGLINALDFDDTLLGHPGSTAVGPALALAEVQHVSGRDLLTALAVGYEVSLRVSEAVRASVGRWRQVAASSTAQTLGAAAVSAKLLELDERATSTAYGLAASMAPIPSTRKFGTQDGGRISWTKNQYPAAAEAGVRGAQLAARGAVGPETILDGETGFWVMAGSDRFDPSALTAGLGLDWRFHNVAFKPYPCCRFFHASIDALQALIDVEHVRPDDITTIRVTSISHLQTFLNRRPITPYDAEFSLPHALALTALGVRPGLAWFDGVHLVDPSVHALMDAVEVKVSPEAEDAFKEHQPYRTKVELVMRNASHREAFIDIPLGHPASPMSNLELDEKFLHLAGSVIGTARAEQALEILNQLPDVDDVARLAPSLV